MDVHFWAATDKGMSREHNEDNYLVDRRLNLFVVCDGMGGHAAGEVASAIAVRVVRDVISNNRSILVRCEEDPDDPAVRQSALRLLEHAIQEACTRIFDLAQNNPKQRGMGTTCSALLITDRRSFIGHVGDSRVYLHRKGQTHQLTEDHSLVNEMKRRGRLQGADTLNLPYKNAITRAVGIYESVEVDTFELDNLPGDRFLLCSDGLSMYLEDVPNLERYLGARREAGQALPQEIKQITDGLIKFANARGGKDNITAVVIVLEATAEAIDEAEDVRLTMETVRNIPLFHYLSYKELVRIINVTHKRTVVEGESIIQEGDRGEELYIILRGEFVVERGGRQLARLKAGRHFGEQALIDDCPRSASVRASSQGTLLTIRRPEFYELLRKDTTMAVKLLWNFIQTLSARLRDLPVQLAQLAVPEMAGAALPAPLRDEAPATRPVMPSAISNSASDDIAHGEAPTPASGVPALKRPSAPPAPPKPPAPNATLSNNAQSAEMDRVIGEDITLPQGIRPEDYGIANEADEAETAQTPQSAPSRGRASGARKFPRLRFGNASKNSDS